MAFGAIAGPITGALLGSMMGGDGEQTQSQSREPWAPIQPWLQELATEGQSLNRYYQQNPFNSVQRTSMQNMLGDIDNYRSNINPGMMAFANRLMNTNYSRNGGNSGRGGGYGSGYGGGGLMGAQPRPPQGGGDMWGTGGFAGPAGGSSGGMRRGGDMWGTGGVAGPAPSGDMGGLLGGMFDAQMAARGAPRETMGDIDQFIASATGALPSGATLAAGMQNQSGRSGGPFNAPAGGMYGLLDWPELNPHTAANGIRPPAPPPAEDPAAARQRETEEEALRRYMESERGGAGA